MFDLERAIAEWRQQMLAAGIKTPVPLEELENHLREEIQRQMKSGLDGQAAFNLAAKKIGQASVLRKEFGKVGGAMSARQRRFSIIVCGVGAVLLGLSGVAILFPSFDDSPSLSFHERLSVSGACVSVALILWSWRFSYSFFPALSKRMRIIIAFLGGVLSGLGAVLLLRFTLLSANTPGQILAAAAWMTVPLALAASIIFALEEAAYRKTAAGVPNHYLTSAMNTFNSNSNIEPGWATYLKSAAYIAPALCLWCLSMIYVVPQVTSLSRRTDRMALPELMRENFGISNLIKDNLLVLAGFGILTLILLEWRAKIWPRYRRAALGVMAFVLNLTFLISLFLFFIAAAIVATVANNPIR
jgi:hypothetical protein